MYLLKEGPREVVEVLPDGEQVSGQQDNDLLLADTTRHSHARACSRQVYQDGTIFVIHDFVRVCSFLMHAYAMASSEAMQLHNDANEIACFLERATSMVEASAPSSLSPSPGRQQREKGRRRDGGVERMDNSAADGHAMSTRRAGVSSRECKPWLCLRNSIKEAGVQPMCLVRKNAAAGSMGGGSEENGDNARGGRLATTESAKCKVTNVLMWLELFAMWAWIECFCMVSAGGLVHAEGMVHGQMHPDGQLQRGAMQQKQKQHGQLRQHERQGAVGVRSLGRGG